MERQGSEWRCEKCVLSGVNKFKFYYTWFCETCDAFRGPDAAMINLYKLGTETVNLSWRCEGAFGKKNISLILQCRSSVKVEPSRIRLPVLESGENGCVAPKFTVKSLRRIPYESRSENAASILTSIFVRGI